MDSQAGYVGLPWHGLPRAATAQHKENGVEKDAVGRERASDGTVPGCFS